MRVQITLSFTTKLGKTWDAPAGSKIDGASISRPLWSIIGSPYVGDYRRASVIHDVACEPGKEAIRKEADKMFYYACREGGCSWLLGKAMYIGVRIGAWISASGRDLVYRSPERGQPSAPLTRDDETVAAWFVSMDRATDSLPEDSEPEVIDAAIEPMKAIVAAGLGVPVQLLQMV